MCVRSLMSMLGTVSALVLAVPVQGQSTLTLQTETASPGISSEIQRQTDGGGIRLIIQPRISGNEHASLDLQRETEMREAVVLGLRTDPRLVPPTRVIEMVESIGMVDDAGIRIVSGYDISVEHDLVVASSVGRVEITNIHDGAGGLVITALVRDGQGNIIDPPEGSLAVYRTGGERLCFTEDVITNREVTRQSPIAASGEARLPMSFVLLLDRSGSMAEHSDEVRAAAHAFLDALPENASCSVGAFSEGNASYDEAEGFGEWLPCRASSFSLEGLDDAGGNTNLYMPLESAYRWLTRGTRGSHQRLVIVITDGVLNQALAREESVRAAKGDNRTFVYHVGGQEERFLSSIADHYLAHEGDLATSLNRYFEVLSEGYSSQTVLRLGQCSAPVD